MMTILLQSSSVPRDRTSSRNVMVLVQTYGMSLLVPVVRLVSLFTTAHVQQICTTVQYCRYKKKRRPPRTTVEIPFNI